MSSDGASVNPKGEEMEKTEVTSESKISKPIRSEAKENVNVEHELNLRRELLHFDKNKDIPGRKIMGKQMVGLPPINVNELTSILQDPSMPSQDLMKEVAQKIRIRNDEIESKAASVESVNPLGIQSVFDCIMEVTLSHTDDSSDEEADEHEPHVLEIPCDYCKKIFGSTMSLKTHVLMTHSQDDPSVLNIRLRASIDDDKIIQLSAKKDDGVKRDAKLGNERKGDLDVKCRSRKPSGNIGKGGQPQLLSPADKKVVDDSRSQDCPTELSNSGKFLTSSSPTALELTTVSSSSKSSRSSLRRRSAEKPDINKGIADLTHDAMEGSKSQSSSSSLPQNSSLPKKRGKRKIETITPTTAKREKRSQTKSLDYLEESEAPSKRTNVQVRRSSRRK